MSGCTYTLSNSVQITEARAALAESIPAELEQLMRMYVEPLKVKQERRRTGRSAIASAMRDQFERAGVWGLMQPTDQPIVGELIPGLPAAVAKLQADDRIVSINGAAVATWEDMAKTIHEHPSEELTLQIQREGKLTYVTFVFE